MDVRGIDQTGYDYSSVKIQKQGNTVDELSKKQEESTIATSVDDQTVAEEPELSEREQLRRMERLQDTLKNHNIEISYNEEANRYAIKVLDSDSKEVVKEIPSEKTLEMFAKMLEIEGLLVDEKR